MCLYPCAYLTGTPNYTNRQFWKVKHVEINIITDTYTRPRSLQLPLHRRQSSHICTNPRRRKTLHLNNVIFTIQEAVEDERLTNQHFQFQHLQLSCLAHKSKHQYLKGYTLLYGVRHTPE